MDLFTQSVDASLQTSRAFDDPSHFHNPAAAAASRRPIVANPSTPVPATHLLIPLGQLPSLALHALHRPPLPPPCATLSALDQSPVPIVVPSQGLLEHCAVASLLSERVVDDSSAFQFAQALLDLVQTSGIVLVVCAVTRIGVWAGVHGVRVLATTAVEDEVVGGLAHMEEPMLLGGVAAAVMAEAEMRGRRAVCVVGDSGGGVSVDEVLQVVRVVQAVGGFGGEVGVDEVRRVMGRGGGDYDGIYM